MQSADGRNTKAEGRKQKAARLTGVQISSLSLFCNVNDNLKVEL